MIFIFFQQGLRMIAKLFFKIALCVFISLLTSWIFIFHFSSKWNNCELELVCWYSTLLINCKLNRVCNVVFLPVRLNSNARPPNTTPTTESLRGVFEFFLVGAVHFSTPFITGKMDPLCLTMIILSMKPFLFFF